MTIETKYNIGDEVSYRPKHPALSHVETSTIRWIDIEVGADGDLFVLYTMDNAESIEESRILPK